MTRDQPGRELATVTRLPVIVDAELVDDDRPVQQQLYARRMRGYARDITAVTRVTHGAVTHPRVVPVWRHIAYVGIGASELWKRRRDSRSDAVADRQIAAAEARNDPVAAAEWFDRRENARKARHERRKDWAQAPVVVAKMAGATLFGLVALLLVLGAAYAYATGDWHDIATPLRGTALMVAGLIWFLIASAVFLPPAAVTLVTLICWAAGRHHAERLPEVIAPATVQRDSDTITSDRVVLAFRDLGITALRKAIVAAPDGGKWMLSGPGVRIAGCGVEVDVTLPPGVTTAEVMARRRKLAENLDRHEHEVHVTVAPQARTVRVWAADSGALDEPIGASPLVYDEDLRGDYARGKAPWGENLRGDALPVSLYQRHVLIVGLSNQGKTKTLRALALWLALDVTAEFRIADLKGDGDWVMFDGLATVYIEGPSDEHVIAATEMLEDGVREMDARLLEQDRPRHPLILIVDEAQQAYMCPEKDAAGKPYGGAKSTSRYLTAVRKIQNQGRAVNVLLWQGTQNPTNQNLPVLAREGAHLRISTVVGTEEQSRMALGDKAVDGGAAPHLLRSGLDRGTVVVAGDGAPLANGESSVTVRTHFIDDDAAAVVAGRAKALRGPVRPQVVEEERDLLVDVMEALGEDDMVNAADMPARLRVLAPYYRPYRHLDGTRLAELLGAEGVEVTKLKGTPMVRAERVQKALDERRGE